MDLLDDAELTEFEAIDVQSIKGVGQGANGFPILMMKGLEPVAKGARDCPECDKTYDADHKGDNCESCGAKLPAPPAAKASGGDGDDAAQCPTCKGKGKIRGGAVDCPDCEDGKVTPAKRKALMGKSLAAIIRAAPHLEHEVMLKAVGADGEVDEAPDIDGGTQILALIADMIVNEAQELKAGSAGEIDDIFELASAAMRIWMWRTGEQAVASGSVMPAEALMQSAAGGEAAKGGPTKAERDKAASEGNALEDGSYPIRNLKELGAAAVLAQSGHGNVAAAKKLIAKRAKELGVANPLEKNGGPDGDTKKSQIANGETNVDTEDGTGGLAKAVADAVTKATAPLKEQLTLLGDELAKVKATPVPGGPVLSRNVQVKDPRVQGDSELAAKAALYRSKADMATSPADREGYLALARETETQAKASPVT